MPNNDKNKYEADKLEAQKRFEKLPNDLKKELLSDKNAKLVISIAQDYKLDEDQVKKVNLLVMEVFLGYLKPEEIASELHTFFDIDLQKANFVEIELKQKLLNPLKADLEKNYNPPSLEEQEKKQEPDKIDEKKEIKSHDDLPVSEGPIIIKPEPTDTTGNKPSTRADSIQGTQPTTYNKEEGDKIKKNKEEEEEKEGETVNYSQATTHQRKLDTRQTTDNQPSVAPPSGALTNKQEAAPAPFIIQTKDHVLKTTTPNLSNNVSGKGPSLNLKVDSSFIKKPSQPKPVSIRLETELPKGDKFGMPLSTNNLQPFDQAQDKPITNDEEKKSKGKNDKQIINNKRDIKSEKPIINNSGLKKQVSTPIKPSFFSKIKNFITTSSPKTTNEQKPIATTPKITNEQKPIIIAPKATIFIQSNSKPISQLKETPTPIINNPPSPSKAGLRTGKQEKIDTKKTSAPKPHSQISVGQADQAIFQKPISEIKTTDSNLPKKEPIKTIHYIGHKTNLSNTGIPKKTEPKKEDIINLATFTKVSGNTVDLRSIKNNK
jgi:hypothetical protein